MSDTLRFNKILSKYYRITMGDGSVWAIPVGEIAQHRAEFYLDKFDGDFIKSLYEDTLPLFADSPIEVKKWAVEHMDWEDARRVAQQVKPPITTKRYHGDWNVAKQFEVR